MDTGIADEVVELRRKYPSMKAIEIARQVKVSRERVRQIKNKALEKLRKDDRKNGNHLREILDGFNP